MPRKAREQEFNVELNVHLRHDPILLRDITRFILLAIELGEEEERKEELQKNHSGEFPQREQTAHGL